METVAPHAGAWIETISSYGGYDIVEDVAPHAGAWIETNYGHYFFKRMESHPTRVRGLKPLIKSRGVTRVIQVAPHAGAWIET